MLFTASRDWEQLKMLSHETVHRNWIKLVASTSEGKGVKQPEMFDYSVYNR